MGTQVGTTRHTKTAPDWATTTLLAREPQSSKEHADECGKDASVVWITVCTPPKCNKDTLLTLRHLKRTSQLPIVILDSFMGSTVSMSGGKEIVNMKQRMLLEYLQSPQASHWKHVIFADSVDVIANPASATEVVCLFQKLALKAGG